MEDLGTLEKEEEGKEDIGTTKIGLMRCRNSISHSVQHDILLDRAVCARMHKHPRAQYAIE